MKEIFPEFYRADHKRLWKEAIFVFDANVLLNLYRYSPKTTSKFFEVCKQLDGRIWVPYQFAYEYQKNRLSTIEKQRQDYDELLREIDSQLEKAQTLFRKYSRHAFIKSGKLLGPVEKAYREAATNVKKCGERHPNWFENDTVLAELEELLRGKIGAPYDDAKYEQMLKDADLRLQKRVPPGFKDVKKSDVRMYGDTIGWFQILDHAMLSKKSMVFVSDDGKEDWWWEVHGKTIGPRFELVKEFKTKTKMDFHMYSSESFLKNAKLIDKKVDAETIKEVAELSEPASPLDEVVSADLDSISLDVLARMLGYKAASSSSRVKWRDLVDDVDVGGSLVSPGTDTLISPSLEPLVAPRPPQPPALDESPKKNDDGGQAQ